MNGRSRRRPWRSLSLALAFALCSTASRGSPAASAPYAQSRLDGVNVIAVPGYPFGEPPARLSLAEAKRIGARTVAVIPFLWQATPASPDLKRGNDMTDMELCAAIGEAHALGLAVVVKPHVWVPQSWAGAVAMTSDEDWRQWFANYRREVLRIARIAAEGKAEALVIGTELTQTIQRPEWNALIGAVRKVYGGRLLYMAHNVEAAEAVPFWDRLDAVGVTLYPPLGADDDGDGRRLVMLAIADRLDALAARTGKPIVVGEIGLRSAVGAAARPWESTEERPGEPDPALQAAVLADWLKILDRPAIGGVMIWCWFTDPFAGGTNDTDFTVQGKPAERVLLCAWTRRCEGDQAGIEAP